MESPAHSPSPTHDQQPLVVPHTRQRPDSSEYTPHTPPVVAAHFPQSMQYAPPREGDIADHGAQYHSDKPDPTHESASMQEARAVDWIVPVQNGGPPHERRRTVEDRLRSTLEVAKVQQAKYARRASLSSMAVNGAMFLQIILNALVTGLSAAQNNRSAQIGVSALGAIGTIIASFLVRVRGTREPERSVTHAQNLEKFIRELEAFVLDEGFSTDRKWDDEVREFRQEFDRLQTAVHQSENGQPMSEAPSSKLGDVQKGGGREKLPV